MQLELTGKKAFITGSSRGIGRVIAEILHDEGCIIALNGRNKNDLAAAASDLDGAATATVQGDVTQPDDAQRIITEVVEKLGRLDILICNVGSGRSVSPGDETYEEWQRVFGLNLWSTTNIVEAARESLVATSGAIVCVSSICGIEVVPGAPVTYSVAKAALNSYVHGISRPLGKNGVRINAVAPGNILFDGSVWSKKLTEDASSVESMLKRDVALSRLGDAREVAELVAYLASPRAAFATGGVWTLDGGQVHS